MRGPGVLMVPRVACLAVVALTHLFFVALMARAIFAFAELG
jgi:hypothetical protein